MKIKCGYLSGNARLYRGVRLDVTGVALSAVFQPGELKNSHVPIPVRWNGDAAELYFWSWRSKRTPCNHAASNLIEHPGFVIRGPALVITGAERWHSFRVEGSEAQARSLTGHVLHGLKEPQNLVFKPSGRHGTHTYISVRNDDDAFVMRMTI